MLIPRHALIVGARFGSLSAANVSAALARGLRAGGLPEPDILLLPDSRRGEVREMLDTAGFDARMRGARAVIVVAELLQERTLAGTATFEIATRARQAGVPAYAITAENRLDPFDARILDLQLILEATSTRALMAAGRKLANVL
jgi:glycerate kinase